MRLVKGSHIVTPKFWDGPHSYLVQNHDKRVIFVNPYEGDKALIGTTDVPWDGAPENVSIDEAEIEYLLAAVNRYFKQPLRREDVLQTFSGVRPLYDDGNGNPSAVTRDYVFDLDTNGRRAHAQCLRRQDHHLSQAVRARDATPAADLPDNGARLDGHRACCPAVRSRRPMFRNFMARCNAISLACRAI